MTRSKTEAVTPPDTIARLLDAAGDELVLVGGQALAFWLAEYDLLLQDDGLPAITNDVDFLTQSPADKAAVRRMAGAIKGQTLFPNHRALTALVGQAFLELSADEYLNVDVIFKVIGLRGDDVRKRAVKVVPGAGRAPFLVMHPLDVLFSRLMNLYKLPDKQNDKGRMQLALAIDVGRAFLRNEAARSDAGAHASGRSPLQGYVSAIERMATDDAGAKVAQRHALHVADAIDPLLIPAGPFWTKRWPGLRLLMSPGYAAGIAPPE